MAVELEWGELPPAARPGRKGNQWDSTVAALRERPGEWACVQRDVASASLKRLTERGCEAVTRPASSGASGANGRPRRDVWARWPKLPHEADLAGTEDEDDEPGPHTKCVHCGRTFGTTSRCADHEDRCASRSAA